MERSNSNSGRLGASFVLVATFALGVLTGAAILFVARQPAGGPPPGRPGPAGPAGPARHDPGPVRHLERELGLDAQQLERLEEILQLGRNEMKQQAETTRERIEAILTPEQLERFETMRPPPPRRHGPPRGDRPPHPPRRDRDRPPARP
ncbi:MAG: hypothetical protein GY716_06655 [bacterium]|nr:hypothetical protein [bacterium]